MGDTADGSTAGGTAFYKMFIQPVLVKSLF